MQNSLREIRFRFRHSSGIETDWRVRFAQAIRAQRGFTRPRHPLPDTRSASFITVFERRCDTNLLLRWASS